MKFEPDARKYVDKKTGEETSLPMMKARNVLAADVSVKLPYQEDLYSQNLETLQRNLGNCLEIIEDEVMKGYITKLSNLRIAELDQDIIKSLQEIYFFRVTQLVYQEDEFSVHKLSTVFHTLSNKPCTLVMMVKSDGIRNELYMGVRSLNEKNSSGTMMRTLKQSLLGLFPGSRIESYYNEDMKKDLQRLHVGCISSATCVADYKQEKEEVTNQDFIQGLEKFIYSMQGRAYTAFFIADNLSYSDLMEVRQEYEKIYTLISPFADMQLNFSINSGVSKADSRSEGKSQTTTYGTNEGSNQTFSHGYTETKGRNENSGTSDAHGTNASVSDGQTDTTGHTDGVTHTVSDGHTEGTSNSTGIGMQTGTQVGRNTMASTTVNTAVNTVFTLGGKVLGVAIGGSIGGSIGESVGKFASQSIGASLNKTSGKSSSDTHTISDGTSHTDSVSQSLSKTLSHGINDTHTVSKNVGSSQSEGNSITYATGRQKGSSYSVGDAFNLVASRTLTDTFGSSQGMTLNTKNMTLQATMDRLEQHLKRINECESLGMWNFAAYFLGESAAETETAANTYQSVVSGFQSGIERVAVNTWTEGEKLEKISKYIQNFIHPFFIYEGFSYEGDRNVLVNPSALVSTNELAIHMGIPRRSVCGLPVVEHAVFAQEILKSKQDVKRKIHIGNIFHLGQKTELEATLDADSLSMHTFITGSTGSGKSNTVYQLLGELERQNIQFLVIEPTKGEYKHIFGGKEGVSVYSTNQNKSPLLRLNPFSFPEDIHVLEHMDRLVEIFNACWPMYAAMPAVLKDAIEQAYRRKGWDMTSSECHPRIFPTFADLMEELPRIISSSAYSEDTKGDYVGSLVTRVKSLTNGINGQIFCSFAELTGEELFDRNVIVDISRVGSMETKSLIMGILVMKLQEYRMASEGANRELQHVTVLEEAHHLLRRTSSAQSQESSNLQGKSVEMIANAIAEMRTYGEGFIIADQAPGLMDESVIRNTNTKIILRLPDEADRILVGKSAALKEKQVEELAKLPVGVAAVYQNDWLEAVLCEVDEFEEKEKYKYERIIETEDFSACFFCLYGKSDLSNLSCEEIEKMRDWISQLSVSERTKSLLKKCINGNSLRQEEKEMVTYNLFRGKYLAQLLENAEDEKEGIKSVQEEICFMYGIKSPELVAEICNVLLQSIFSEGKTPQLQKRYMEYMGRKTVS